ncbi:hypothetical protein CKALI_09130 [Corynebacterium kalinowskii]|uniref:Uncharacterized protein n=1 Tax=Corynebacterium kalinowskii TaxID=2675216 RepID=A0A6B8VS18_9CORY|nr:hypothetical protein [Corynebacterium kalinowskii]QGU02681.1 hypothetical protein CKALI_09130 [Corynebacterium kalinowskii]
MLRAIPGYSHLKCLSPSSQRTAMSAPRSSPDASLRACIQIALDVACGVRPTASLQRPTYDGQVRIHVRAYLKAHTLRGPVALQHIDVRLVPPPPVTDPFAIRILEAAEVVGTYSVSGKAKAFATRLELPEGKRQWIMRTLRLF